MPGFTILEKRGVSRLCHFTKLQNLSHVLSKESLGILSTEKIRSDTKHVTDSLRYDGHIDYICCSVEYPNSWYLERNRTSARGTLFNDWVVIYIDLQILRDREAKFCPCNAAKDRGAHIVDDISDIESIYAQCVQKGHVCERTPDMLSCCPTDGQAEVLVKDSIPICYFRGIAVKDEEMAERVRSMLELNSYDSIPVFVGPDVLSTGWVPMVKRGERPKERRYSGHTRSNDDV